MTTIPKTDARATCQPTITDNFHNEPTIRLMMIGATCGPASIISSYRRLREDGQITPTKYFEDVVSWAIGFADRLCDDGSASDSEIMPKFDGTVTEILRDWGEPEFAAMFAASPATVQNLLFR
jgi:hypothetical protein